MLFADIQYAAHDQKAPEGPRHKESPLELHVPAGFSIQAQFFNRGRIMASFMARVRKREGLWCGKVT